MEKDGIKRMRTHTFPCILSMPVWYETEKEPCNQYVEFRQTFVSKSTKARLYISCDSRAVVYLNNRFVGLVLYDGTEKTCWYEEFELTDCKENEENELKMLVYYQGTSSSNYTVFRPQLIFGLEVWQENGQWEWTVYSGEKTFCRIDAKYQSGPVERNQMGYVWHYDASVQESPWKPAKCWEDEDREYRKRPIQRQKLEGRMDTCICAHGYLPDEQGQEFDKVMLNPIPLEEKLSTDRPYYLIIDCREECTGLLDLEIDGGKGSKIYLGWGEHLADKRVRSHIGARYFECSYGCMEGKQNFIHYFHRMGLRYLELHVYPAEGRNTDCLYAGILPLMYPVKESAYLRIPDQLHQKIYDVAVKTLKLCMHEHYEDCPWREQALYAMDALNQALCGYYCFGEYPFAASCLELFGEGLKEDGFLELHTPGKDAVAIPYFTFMWVIGIKDYLLHSKDEELVIRLWSKIRQVVDKRLEECKQGLLLTQTSTAYWNFYEWNDLLSGEPIYRDEDLEKRVDAPYQMSFLLMLEAVKTISHILGYTEYEEKLDHIICQMQRACFELFWETESESFLTYAYENDGEFYPVKGEYGELVQAWAVLSGVVTGTEREKLLLKLASGQPEWVPCTLSMMRFKYEALLLQPERYGVWVFQDISKIWGEMLLSGATSFWETEDGEAAFDGAGSLCHGWSAMPVYFYHAYASIPGGTLYGESTAE